MLTLQKIPELLQQHFMDLLLRTMEDAFPDYVPIREKKEAALRQLEEKLSDAAVSAAEDVAAATQQIASTGFFSAFLGLKANLDHYIDPIKQSFLDVEPELYLRETLACSLPTYIHAETIRNQFYDMLTSEQQEIYQPIQDYVVYMETVLPKLAHYFGYILGNYLLPKVVPAYVPDQAQTIRYRQCLSDYFGGLLLF